MAEQIKRHNQEEVQKERIKLDEKYMREAIRQGEESL